MKKHILNFFLLMIALMIPVLALAQDAVISNDEFISFLLESIGGYSGVSLLGGVALTVQIILKFLNTELMDKWFSKQKGQIKLTVVTGLTLVAGILTLVTSGGLSFTAALVHSSTLAAGMVFAHQIYKQFASK